MTKEEAMRQLRDAQVRIKERGRLLRECIAALNDADYDTFHYSCGITDEQLDELTTAICDELKGSRPGGVMTVKLRRLEAENFRLNRIVWQATEVLTRAGSDQSKITQALAFLRTSGHDA